MRILFLIRSLDRGGAERQLVALATGLHRRGHEVAVAVFYAGGALQAPLTEAGVPVHDLGKRGRWDLRFLHAFRALVAGVAPDVLHGYLPTANLVCLAARGALPPHGRIVWGVRSSLMDLARYDAVARLTYWLERRLAGRSDLIVVNSRAGRRRLLDDGLPESLIRTVPNGIDTAAFARRPGARETLRRAWGIGAEEVLVGLVARVDPMKGHRDFLAAAAALEPGRRPVRFVCIGGGDAAARQELRDSADARRLGDRLTWVDELDDMPAAYAALDIATNCSHGEGFSNVVAEAMACECPCVVTDVGDSSWIVGETGEVVPPREPESLARGWLRLLQRLDEDGDALRAAARRRVVELFSVDALAEHTLQALTFEDLR